MRHLSNKHTMKSIRIAATLFVLASVAPLANAQYRWYPFGPSGGDARAFASDPKDHNHIYLGTVSGTIYDSHDGGESWAYLASVGKRDDLVLDNIVVDPANPRHILVGAWALGGKPDGGLYVTQDGGKTWTSNPQVNGHAIYALTAAPSDPRIVVLGALDGVYRSSDSGNTWTQISPAGSSEIHEIESIAIDPKDTNIIYAGTWHLPWKTTDGGANWSNMKKGIIEDSDVFSIIVDPANAKNVYLSACSGIYRSTDEGAEFTKVVGMPFSARRTRVLMEDPRQTNTVFAGTTEGLWRTTDSGHTFLRYGDPSWIINDVHIDPTNSQHVLLATDRTGVLVSNDGGITFSSSNKGFTSRQISAITQDKSNPASMWVGVLNDKAAGGVFASTDGGLTWTQKSAGLGGADVFSLAQAPDGTLLAGTRHGIYSLTNDTWKSSGLTLALPPEVDPNAPKPTAKRGAVRGAKGTAAASTRPVVGKRSTSAAAGVERSTPPQESTKGVFAMVTSDNTVFAATEEGILSSTDNGHTWNRSRSTQGKAFHLMSALGPRVLVADQTNLSLSVDKGLNYQKISTPPGLTYLTATAIDDGGRLWVGGREGIFYSDSDGANWKSLKGLYVPDISGIFYDRATSHVLVTSNGPATLVFEVHTPDLKVTSRDAGWSLRAVRQVGDHLLGITPFDGVVIEPKMVATAIKASN